ncbi:hypothetical protein ZTR_10834 [Talaromyces verruculosus]|nr:hypothetical protein ZTR_10834 [Talaromyces verruculosus]
MEVYRLAFPIMLCGQALAYYYSWRRTWEQQGTDPAEAIQQYFEGEEYHHTIEHKWSRTTLQQTIDDNPGKDTLQCLEIMIQALQNLTHSLDPQLRTPAYLWSKIIEATRTHPACQMATGRPSNTVPSLISDLRTSVSQYQDMHHTMQNLTSTPEDEYGIDPARMTVPVNVASFARNLDVGPRIIALRNAMYYEGQPLSNPDIDTLAKAKALETIPVLHFTTGPDSYENFRKAVTTELANRAAKHALGLLSTSMHPDSLGFDLTKEVKSANQSEATIPAPIYQGFESYVSSHRYADSQFQGILIDSGAA